MYINFFAGLIESKMTQHLKFAAFVLLALLSLFCQEVAAMDGCKATSPFDDQNKKYGRHLWKCGNQCL